jgi:competence protein ComEC
MSRRGGPLVERDQRPDLRLALPAGIVWATAFATLAAQPPTAFMAGAALLVAGLILARRRFAAAPVVAAGLLLAAATAVSGGLRIQALAEGPVPGLAADRASVTAAISVTSDPERLPPRARGPTQLIEMVVLRGRIESITAGGRATRVRSPVLVLADDKWLRLAPGSRVVASGRLDVPRGVEPLAAVLVAHDAPVVVSGPGRVGRVAERARAGLREAVSGLPAPERGLVPGLVVGDTSQLPVNVDDDFRAAGLTHLTAVSGANLAILLAMVLGAARWAGLPARAVPVVGALVVIGFVVLARPQPSVLRAAVMGLVALVALATGRSRTAFPALCAAVIALVAIDPWLARSYGFALSVLATAGLVVLAPAWRDTFARRLGPAMADVLAVSLAAQVVCAPVVLLIGGKLNLAAIPANMLAAPAVAPAMLLGVMAAVTALAAPGLAAVFGWLAGLPARWIVEVAERAAGMPGTVPWPRGLAGSAVLVVALIGVMAAAPVVAQRRALLTGLLAITVLFLADPAGIASKWPPAGWLLVACDVGQGDALVLSTGNAAAVAVDAGPDPRLANQCLRALGVRQLSLVLLTHFHADHVAGLPGLLQGRKAAEVEVSPIDEPPEQALRVRRWAADARLPVTRAAAGEQRSVGALRWQVLWPRGALPAKGSEGSAANNASVVMYVERGGVRFLLAGDVEPGAQRALRRLVPAGPVDVLKVAHHGSRFQDPDLLTALHPRLAIVSVGADNDYGHPSPATLDRLARGGAQVMRTDQDGDIAVVKSSSGIKMVRRGPQSDRGDRALARLAWPRGPVPYSTRANPRRAKSRPANPRRANPRRANPRRAKSRRAKSRRAKSRRAKSRRAGPGPPPSALHAMLTPCHPRFLRFHRSPSSSARRTSWLIALSSRLSRQRAPPRLTLRCATSPRPISSRARWRRSPARLCSGGASC